jgi:hypothetical protein
LDSNPGMHGRHSPMNLPRMVTCGDRAGRNGRRNRPHFTQRLTRSLPRNSSSRSAAPNRFKRRPRTRAFFHQIGRGEGTEIRFQSEPSPNGVAWHQTSTFAVLPQGGDSHFTAIQHPAQHAGPHGFPSRELTISRRCSPVGYAPEDRTEAHGGRAGPHGGRTGTGSSQMCIDMVPMVPSMWQV